jgi:hypothetical protein
MIMTLDYNQLRKEFQEKQKKIRENEKRDDGHYSARMDQVKTKCFSRRYINQDGWACFDITDLNPLTTLMLLSAMAWIVSCAF